MNRFRTWLADKINSLAYRIEARAERWHDLSSRIRPKLRYEDMDEFQKRCHDDSNRIAGTIADCVVPERSPWEGLIGKHGCFKHPVHPIHSIIAERPAEWDDYPAIIGSIEKDGIVTPVFPA